MGDKFRILCTYVHDTAYLASDAIWLDRTAFFFPTYWENITLEQRPGTATDPAKHPTQGDAGARNPVLACGGGD